MTKKEPCEEFKASVRRMKRISHTRMPKGYRTDPKDYKVTELIPIPSCENCKSYLKKDREVTTGRYTCTYKACKQKKPCTRWTPFPQETEGST